MTDKQKKIFFLERTRKEQTKWKRQREDRSGKKDRNNHQGEDTETKEDQNTNKEMWKGRERWMWWYQMHGLSFSLQERFGLHQKSLQSHSYAQGPWVSSVQARVFDLSPPRPVF